MQRDKGCRGLRPYRRRTDVAIILGALAVGGFDEAKAQQGPILYIPSLGDDNVSTLDTATNALVPPPIAVGAGPSSASVRGDQSFVYVTNLLGNNVSVIDAANQTVVATVGVGANPLVAAITPNGANVYVSNNGESTLSVIDTATNTVAATIPVGAAPAGVAVTPDGRRVYVANFSSNTVSVIDTATNTVIGPSIPVGISPTGVAVSPDGTRVYVTNTASSSLSVVDTATNTVIGTPIAVGNGPDAVVTSTEGSRIYVTNFISNTVSIIDAATNTLLTTVSVGAGPEGVAVSPDGAFVYVANSFDDSISVIDTVTSLVVGTVATGSTPFFPGICSNGNALLSSGRTFTANTSGALACTMASGASGSPGPVFTGGTLRFAGANISSALPITLQPAGGTFDTNGNNAALSGPISGPGSLTKVGNGTLTFAGASTYSGRTSINAGTFQAGATNAFSPFSAFSVAPGAILDLNGFDQTIGSLSGAGNVALGAGILSAGTDNSSTTFTGVISGTGGLTKTGVGTLILAGDNTYTGGTRINAGTLQLGNGGRAGSVIGDIVDNGTLVFNRSDTLTYGGSISGTGSLSQAGPGTLILSGVSTYSGGTDVTAGTLRVDGTLASTVFVHSGATLEGIGAVGGLAVGAGGLVAPGHSLGTLSVDGNVRFGRGSAYQVEITPTGQSDRIAATGTATLAGGTVHVLAASGSYLPGARYTILTAQGGVTGTFAGLTINSAFLSPILGYDPTEAFLIFPQPVSFQSVALTRNQFSVAGALDASSADTALVQAVLPLSAPGARQAFDALSGELHASLQTALIDNSRYMRSAILSRLRSAFPSADGTGLLAQGGPQFTSLPAAAGSGIAVWAQAVGAWGDFDGDGNAAGFKRDLGGFLAGIDAGFPEAWRIGLAAGYGRTDVNDATRASSADIDTFHLGAYAQTRLGAVNLRGGAAFAWHEIDTSRAIIFPQFF